ncbi:MAG: peroxiredoxin [Prochlorococcaceae cyanobacterium]
MSARSSLLRRRRLLQGLLLGSSTVLGGSLLSTAALGWARPAEALGGTLPELEEEAPPFDLPGVAGGKPVRLQREDFRGRWLVLYFYPRDFTGGCTLEARGFQRDLAAFRAAGAEVVGVSADGEEEHASFCESEGLAFPLLSDAGGAVSRAYGSWIAPFSQRHTFLIDPAGRMRARWGAVRPAGHRQAVLLTLQQLQAGASAPTGSAG